MSAPHTPQREVIAFLAVAFGLALVVALTLPDARINLLLSLMIPTVTVAVLTFTITPRGSRRAVWRSLGLGRAGSRVWPSATVVPLVLCAGAYGTALVIGAGRLRDVDATSTFGTDLLVALPLGSVLILGEEIGWRGYLLPRVQQLTTRRRAAVITGFAHGCFHLPLILFATTYDTTGSRWIAAPVAVGVITAGGVFYAWLWDRAHTVWPVAIAHNVVNTVFDLGAASVVATSGWNLSYVAGETGFATLGACTALAVLLLWRAHTWRSTDEPDPVNAPVHSGAL